MKVSLWGWPLLLAVVVAGSCAGAQGIEPSSGLVNHDGIVYSQRTGKTYVVDSERGGVVILAPASAPKTLKTGAGPVSIAVNERSGRAYVANSGDRSVSVIDGDTGKLIATVRTAARPYAIAVDAEDDKVYVSNTFSDKLTVVDGKTNVATNLKTGSADAIRVVGSRREVYLLGYESSSLKMLKPDSGALVTVPTGATHLWGIAASAKTLYVAHVQEATVAAIDLETHAVREINVPPMPCALVMNPGREEIYVASYDGSVSAIDGKNAAVLWTLRVGGHPQAIAFDAGKGLVYVADAQRHSVMTIDALKHRVVKTDVVEGSPYALAVDEKTHRVIAATMGASPYANVPGR